MANDMSLDRHVDAADSSAPSGTVAPTPAELAEERAAARTQSMEAPKPLILIVDDEAELARTVAYGFEQEGFATRHAETGKAAVDAAISGPTPDLIVLDLMLPDLNGTEVCRELRRHEATRAVPIVFLTARDNEIDRVVAFELGADDYVAKPFSVRELTLRVRALLRRSKATRPPPSSASEQNFERLRVDAEAHQVWVDSSEVSLTALEFRLLHTLLNRRGRVQTRSQLLEDVWGVHADVTTRTVDTHVKRLREKLGEAGNYVETIRGVGYRFRSKNGLER
jgi:two-component system, OmpR family, phosphate regulon response regulator PhoB